METKKQTRETNKKVYCKVFAETFKKELDGTIWTEAGQEMWIEEYAWSHYMKRKDDIESKADAAIFGRMDGIRYTNKIRENARAKL